MLPRSCLLRLLDLKKSQKSALQGPSLLDILGHWLSVLYTLGHRLLRVSAPSYSPTVTQRWCLITGCAALAVAAPVVVVAVLVTIPSALRSYLSPSCLSPSGLLPSCVFPHASPSASFCAKRAWDVAAAGSACKALMLQPAYPRQWEREREKGVRQTEREREPFKEFQEFWDHPLFYDVRHTSEK